MAYLYKHIPEKKKTFVALSGGVDSSVAAALLKECGFDVRGVHIKMWSPTARTDADLTQNNADIKSSAVCKQQYQDRLDAMRVAAHLGIPFETWDFTEEYKRSVVDYMIREYARGRTPNPDVMCNHSIKFGIFLNRALASGADYVATGHYVRVMRKSQSTNYKSQTNHKAQITNHKLLAAKDTNKDQSYFLWTLTQEKLKHCLFPIGEYTKPEVRALARKYNLPTAEKKDSQGLCFMGKIDVREFLKSYIPEKQGAVVTASGKKVGEHMGLAFYTIGQRHGLGIGGRPAMRGEPPAEGEARSEERRPEGAGGTPYYVAEKDFATNTLLVVEGREDPRLNRRALEAGELNWISGQPPKLPIWCEARIRYRAPLKRCSITLIDAKATTNLHKMISENSRQNSYSIRVIFEEAQRAITPGQSIVFYKGEEMLGGGIISDRV